MQQGPGLYYVNEDRIRCTALVLRQCRCFHDSTESLLRPCSLTSSLRFFEHVQNSPTSTKTIKIASRPYRFLLRSFYVVQVRSSSKPFYIDVVGTWSSVTGVLANNETLIRRHIIRRLMWVCTVYL